MTVPTGARRVVEELRYYLIPYDPLHRRITYGTVYIPTEDRPASAPIDGNGLGPDDPPYAWHCNRCADGGFGWTMAEARGHAHVHALHGHPGRSMRVAREDG